MAGFDYSQLDDTALAQQLHNLALQLNVAKGANDVPLVKSLYAEFQRAAAEERSRSTLSGLDALLQSVSDGTEAFLREAAATAGGVASSFLRPLLLPLVVIVVVAGAAFIIYRSVRRAS